jgi:hypothetical protein
VVDEQTAQPTLTPTTAAQLATATPTEAAETEEKEISYVVRRLPVMGDAIANGSFEEGFQENGVGQGWTAFDNAGAVYAWVDETDWHHVSHDAHAQLMRIMGPGQPDRYVGIYQTVEVIAGETYTLSLHGIIRSSTAEHPDTPYGHRMQWAIDDQGGTDWTQVKEWFDTGWNDIPLDGTPTMNVISLPIEAKSDKLTIFCRGWTKWPIINSEAKYYVDGIFLQGPIPGEEKVIKVETSPEEGMPTTGGSGIWLPVVGIALVVGFALWEIRKGWARSP